MYYIKSYFLNIIAVILFTVLIEILMPNNSFKGYIKLVLGLFVVFAVIKPVTSINLFDFGEIPSYEGYSVMPSDIESMQNNQVNRTFLENLKMHIIADVNNKFNDDVDVYIDGDVNELREIVILDVEDENKDDVILHISKTYGVTNVTAGGE